MQTSHPFKPNIFHKQSRFDTTIPQSYHCVELFMSPCCELCGLPAHQNAHVQSYPSAHLFDCGWALSSRTVCLGRHAGPARPTLQASEVACIYIHPPRAPALGVSPNISPPGIQKQSCQSGLAHPAMSILRFTNSMAPNMKGLRNIFVHYAQTRMRAPPKRWQGCACACVRAPLLFKCSHVGRLLKILCYNSRHFEGTLIRNELWNAILPSVAVNHKAEPMIIMAWFNLRFIKMTIVN